MIKTKEGGIQYEHSLDHAIEFFSKAGSIFSKKGNFYEERESVLSLFQKIWIVDKELAFKLLMWLRDCRGGAGNRSGARECYKWLSKYDPEWLEINISLLPEIGRWDDLRSLFDSDLEINAAKLWSYNLKENILAAKWADRSDKPLQKFLELNEAGLRKLLSKIRKNHIVEHEMCTKRWNEIEYEKVPSVAISRYTNAFGRHDEERFEKFKEDLKTGKKKIHASVLFPHDCVRTVLHGDPEIGEAQFNELPNFLEGVEERIIVISDTSGSMQTNISGSVEAIHISQGMALYCSAKISKDNPFHKKFIGFCSEGKFKNWNDMDFAQAIQNRNIFDGAVGSTRIDKALDLILETAKFFNLANEQIPTTLLIISDMQFYSGSGIYGAGCSNSDTEINQALNKWTKANYNKPKIIYWNTDGYAGSPEVANSYNVALISGFSPAILKAIFSAEDFSPRAIMLKALEKYEINVPE